MKDKRKDCLFPRAPSPSLVQHRGRGINSFLALGNSSNWFPGGEGTRQNWTKQVGKNKLKFQAA